MNVDQFLISLIFATGFLVVLLLLDNRRSIKNVSFSVVLVGLTLWISAVFVQRKGLSPHVGHLFLYSESLVLSALYIFSRNFPNKLETYKLKGRGSVVGLINSFGLVNILLLAPLFILTFFFPLNLIIDSILTKGLTLELIGGPLYRYVVALQFLFLFVIIFNFYRQFKLATGARRQRLLYTSLAFAVFGIRYWVVNFNTPIENAKDINVLNLPLLFLFGAVGALSVVDIKLADLRNILRLIIVNMVGLFVPAAIFLYAYDSTSPLDPTKLVLYLILSVLVFLLTRAALSSLVLHYLWPTQSTFKQKIELLAEDASLTLEPKKIIHLCLPVFKDALQLGWVYYYDLQKKKITFDPNQPLDQIRFSLSYLKSPEFSEKLQELSHFLPDEFVSFEKDIYGVLPLKDGEDIDGVFVLGPQLGIFGLSDSQTDEFLLVWRHIKTAYAKAKLYNNLEQRVEEQVKDIKYKNRKLNEIMKTRMEFIHMTSHQLRTPVTALSSILQLLSGSALDEDKRKELMGLAAERAKGLTDLINNVLNIARLEKENIGTEVEQKVNLNLVFGSILPVLESQAHRKGVSIEFEKGNDPIVIGNNAYLEQAFFNIVENAIEHSGGKEIRISMIDDGPNIVVSVEDTGKGVEPSLFPHIFKKHFRSEKSKGAGLGLYLSKKIVDAHPKGMVWFENKKEGGAVFYIRLKKTEIF